MKKQEYLEKLDSLELDKNNYCIISGGVMLMYGLKEETEDIDIKVTNAYFKELQKRFTLIPTNKMDNHYELNSYVEVRTTDYNDKDVVWIEGYPVESLEKQLAWKQAHHRPKDEHDIELIKQYLENHK